MKIIPIVENKVYSQGLIAEHGLSLYIEYNGMNILFDFGQGPNTAVNNSKLLGINLRKVNLFVLSHGHYDHSGGILSVGKLLNRKRSNLFLGQGAFVKRFRDKAYKEQIGIPFDCKAVEEYFQINEVSGVVRPAEGIFLSGPIPQEERFSITVRPYYKHKSSIDDFSDEIALYLIGEKGLVVITGCSHRGILNIIEHGRQVTGMRKVQAVIGGFHLSNLQEKDMVSVLKGLKSFQISKLYPIHCVALNELCRIKNSFSKNCFLPYVGYEIA